MPTPAEIVRDFIAAWPEGDADKLAEFFSDDAVYHNIPVEPIVGREDIRSALAGFLEMVDRIHFETLHLIGDGPVVMTERVDHFVQPGQTISLPVMGTFEVHDGKITAWRDYFDMGQFTAQVGGQPS